MNNQHLALRHALTLAALIPAVPLAVSSAHAQSQQTGSISGRVLNEATGEYLRNAQVSVAGTSISTLAGQGGYFQLTNVPAGEVTLVVTYTGLEPVQKTVTVVSGERIQADIGVGLDQEVVHIEEFRVAGAREGNAKAIMAQRVSVNLKKVISADAIGSVSEGNVGEFLKLMPGIAMDYVEADTRAMRVRGLNPKYAMVLFDGMQPANAGSSNVGTGRVFEFEQLSITSVETVELTKAPTPDQPSSVAGTVNLRSKSAFDRKGRHIGFTTAFSWNSYYATLERDEGWDHEKHYKVQPNVNLEFSDVYLGGKLGVIAGFNLSNTLAAQKHVWFFNPTFNTNYDDNATEMPTYTRIWYQDGPKPTERGNYNVRVDYRLNENLQAFGRIDYTTYNARFYNRTMSLFPTVVEPGATWTDQTVTAGSIATNSNQFMTKEGNTTMLTGGARYSKNDFSVDLGLHYSRARNWYGNLEHGHFTDFSSSIQGVSWRMTRPSAGSPDLTFTQLGGPDWRNIENYNFDNNSVGWHERSAKDQQWTARLDFKHDFSRLAVPQIIKYGLLTNLKVLDVKRAGMLTANPTGPDGVMGTADDLRPADFVDQNFRADWGFGGNMNDWVALSPWRLYQDYRTNPGNWRENTANNSLARFRGNWDFKEKIHAAYLSDTFQLGKWEITPGIRYEATESTGKGIDASFNPGRPITGGSDYDEFLKYLHVSYKFSHDLQFRASYHDAITRADIANLIPGISNVDSTAQRVTASNPDIKPERSRTINASVEYYFEPVGVVSLSVFDTEIKDRQFANITRLGPSGYAGDTQYANWELVGPVNVSSPTGYKGYEIDYSQQLSFLPGVLKGFGIFANHTRVIFDDWAFNTGSPERMTNGGISYKHKRFSGRINLNHVGKLLQNPARTYSAATDSWTNAAPYVQVYQRDRLVTDINLEFDLTNSLTLFIDGRNILNEESVYTYFEREHNFERILKTGGIWMAGIKGSF